MDRVQITDDLDFSRIVYGMWRLGDDADTSPAHVQAKIEACLAQLEKTPEIARQGEPAAGDQKGDDEDIAQG